MLQIFYYKKNKGGRNKKELAIFLLTWYDTHFHVEAIIVSANI